MTFDEIRRFYAVEEYPALALRTQQWAGTKPLKGVKVLDGAPVFRNTVLKHLALLEAGAELTVGISDVMPYDSEVLEFLRESGIPVVHADDEPTEQDIILDCAGAFSKWNPRIGVSELTRSGAHVYEDAGKPVFLADEGRIKRIETCLGTGDGFFRAMQQLGYTDWAGRRIVVFGSGKVGTGIINKAVRCGALVDVVTEPETLTPFVRSLVHSVVDFRDKAAVERVICGEGAAGSAAYAVVTATGVKGAVESCCSAEAVLRSGALLANMGVEDEFGDAFPATAVLSGKRPLNFILEEPTQMRYIEATMALHNEGALYLLRKGKYAAPVADSSGSTALPAGIITPPAEMEAEILDITRRAGLIADELDFLAKVCNNR